MFFSSTLSDFTLVAWNRPQWEYVYHTHVHKLSLSTPEQCFLSDWVLSVWPECGPQPRVTSDLLEREAETFIQKLPSLGSHICRGGSKLNCYALKGFHYSCLLVCRLYMGLKISRKINNINGTDQVSFISWKCQWEVKARMICSDVSSMHGPVYMVTGSVSNGSFQWGMIKSDFSLQETLGPGGCLLQEIPPVCCFWGASSPRCSPQTLGAPLVPRYRVFGLFGSWFHRSDNHL